MPEAPSLSIGALLASRYRIEARLGAGGMGVVFRAQDERLGRAVALKVVSQKGGVSAVRRLQREARAVASLDHRGIAMLFDVVDVADVGVVLVMELVRGESLRAMLEEGPRPPREAARIVLDVAESLGAAHRAGLVHRDVKPDNIIVRPDGRTALLDFGIAKAVTERSDEPADSTPFTAPRTPSLSGDTTEGLVVGTPAYLAPEQAMASADISGAADQFALGVVAYELLTGVSPWGYGTDGATLLAQIVREDPPRPSGLQPRLGPSVDAVIARALCKDPSARFGTIEEMGYALVDAVAEVAGMSSRPRVSVRRPPLRALPFANTLPIEDAPPANTGGPLASNDAAVTTSKRPAPPVPRRWRRASWVGAAITAAAVVTFAATRALHPSPPAHPPSEAAPGSTAAAPAPRVRYADVPPSSTRSPEATHAFHEAMIALRDADDNLAEQRLSAAIAADPGFGSAHLQRAILRRRIAWSDDTSSQLAGRDDYVAATAARDTLSARDRALLEAFEPTFNQLPSDIAATEVRVAALAAKSSDAQEWNLVGRLRRERESLDGAREAFDRELTLDPDSAAALRARAAIFTARGDLAGAAASYEQCFRTQPRAALCRDGLAMVLDWDGQCDAFVKRAREYAALSPDDHEAVMTKLSADVFSGVPRAAIDDEIHSLSGVDATNSRSWLHEIDGDLGGASEILAGMEQRAVRERNSVDFAYSRQARVEDLWEAGRVDEAAALAATYEGKLAALPALDGSDHLPYMLSILRLSGRISPDEAARRRAAWIDRWRPSYPTPPQRFLLWISAYARGAFTEADAKDAMEALPSFVDALPSTLLVWLPSAWSNRESVARTLVLAGHPRARAFVEDAARECTPNFYGVRLQYWSGLLYERASDAPSACAAYRRVLSRWGEAKPASITALASRAHMRALGCEPGTR